jgi:CheY-like chemotaxis protein
LLRQSSVPTPFSHLRVYTRRQGETRVCPVCGGTSARFITYYGDLTRCLMRCGCGELFVLSCSDQLAVRDADSAIRALVVEPHGDTRELYGALLTHYGASVKSSATAREALSAIRQWRPSVVSTELRLPDGDGIDLCRQLRSSYDSTGVPIAIVTGETRAERLAVARDVAEIVLVKPCSVEEYVIQVMLLARSAGRTR